MGVKAAYEAFLQSQSLSAPKDPVAFFAPGAPSVVKPPASATPPRLRREAADLAVDAARRRWTVGLGSDFANFDDEQENRGNDEYEVDLEVELASTHRQIFIEDDLRCAEASCLRK